MIAAVIEYAIQKGSLEDIWKLLLVYKPNISTHNDGSILKAVVEKKVKNDRKGTLEILLKNGLDVNAILFGTSPLDSAIHCSREIEIIKLLLDYGAEHKHNIFQAVSHGRGDVIELLLKFGASINEKDNNGRIALHLAVQGDNTKAVELLLEFGATIDKDDLQVLYNNALSNFCKRSDTNLHK